MNRDELVDSYFSAWNAADTTALLKLLHPEASYFDAFWGETCSGRDLAKYFAASFEAEARWYRPDPDVVVTPNGMVVRYVAFEQSDTDGLNPIFNGAEVFTVSGDQIMTISDYYCDPTTADLVAIAALAEGQHGRANAVAGGLGGKAANQIEQRLARLVKDMTFFTIPEVSVTKLAAAVDCSVMHLFHVLEVQKQTTFLELVNECRARFASTLLVHQKAGAIEYDVIARQSGFESIENFSEAFRNTFGVSVDEYVERFSA